MGSSHIFSEIFIHVTWHCLSNQGLIHANIEKLLFAVITEQCVKTKGVYLLALNGTTNHVHWAFQMEPTVNLSELIGHIKGASAHAVNQQLGRKAIQWQRGFGAVSFSKSQKNTIINYVKNQKTHHSIPGQLIAALEATGVYEDSVGES